MIKMNAMGEVFKELNNSEQIVLLLNYTDFYSIYKLGGLFVFSVEYLLIFSNIKSVQKNMITFSSPKQSMVLVMKEGAARLYDKVDYLHNKKTRNNCKRQDSIKMLLESGYGNK